MGLIKKLRKAKKEAPPNEKPVVVKTHLRDMIIVPEMIGSVVGIYNGKVRSGCSHTHCKIIDVYIGVQHRGDQA
jgi:small subunit ribosomal protein S15e